MPSAQIRPYKDADAQSWLRCRLLSFFPTQYYDDVVTQRPSLDEPSIRLVGIVGDTPAVESTDPPSARSARAPTWRCRRSAGRRLLRDRGGVRAVG